MVKETSKSKTVARGTVSDASDSDLAEDHRGEATAATSPQERMNDSRHGSEDRNFSGQTSAVAASTSPEKQATDLKEQVEEMGLQRRRGKKRSVRGGRRRLDQGRQKKSNLGRQGLQTSTSF